VLQLKYYGGRRALAMPGRGVFFMSFSACSIYDHASINWLNDVPFAETKPSRFAALMAT
jgi:hypothetical protein